jgi:hypothetical protein
MCNHKKSTFSRALEKKNLFASTSFIQVVVVGREGVPAITEEY